MVIFSKGLFTSTNATVCLLRFWATAQESLVFTTILSTTSTFLGVLELPACALSFMISLYSSTFLAYASVATVILPCFPPTEEYPDREPELYFHRGVPAIIPYH